MAISIKWYKIVVCIYLLGFVTLGELKSQCHLTDFMALKALYENTNGADWTNNSLWEMVSENDTPKPDCDLSYLHGVSLNAEYRVNIVDLFNNNLTGTLPASILPIYRCQITTSVEFYRKV